jgi:hypothetical protein
MQYSPFTLQHLTTAELSIVAKTKPSTIRTRLCKTGSFYGIKPIKLPSGRLLWPAEAVQALLNGKEC